MPTCCTAGLLLSALVALGCGGSGGSGAGTGGASATGGAGSTSTHGPGAGGGNTTGSAGGSSTSSSMGGASGGPYRPFSSDSPWNTPIAANPTLDPDSDALIADLATSTTSWNYLDVNMSGYSVPLYVIDSTTTPKRSVACNLAGDGFPAMVPIPDGAMPDPMSDHHISIIDEVVGTEWGMWNAAVMGDGSWTCGVGAIADLKGTGVRPPITTANPWQAAVGARASGFPLIAGLIRVEEAKAGNIDHALVIAYPHCKSRYFLPPASTAQGTTSEALPDRGVPMGGRIQLDPTLDVTAMGLTPTNVLIARALQKYGAYVGDFSGAISLYAENGPEAQAAWNAGLLDVANLRSVFDQAGLQHLRVLEIGTLLDNNN